MLRRVSVALVLGLAVVGSAGAATVFGGPNTGPAGSLSLYPLGLDSPQSSGPPSGVDLGGQPPDLPASAVGGADPLELYRRNSHAGRDVDLGAGVSNGIALTVFGIATRRMWLRNRALVRLAD